MASGNSSVTITGTHQLTATQFAAVSQLATLCNETEGLKLKLTEAAIRGGAKLPSPSVVTLDANDQILPVR